MLPTLLSTKLYIPPARPDLVPRPRLIERLDEGIRRKLTLISAPAGFGKTTLLAAWVKQCSVPVAWVSLDAADSDSVRVLAYIIAALQTVDAVLGSAASAMLQSPQPPPIDAVLTALINDVTRRSTDLMLILDDYHLIQSENVQQALVFLLDHQPPRIHLVIATRADPPLPLAYLRGHDQLVEVRQTDLVFTRDEAAAFLVQSAGLSLPAGDIDRLAAHTEGWIAGLHMAALSMKGRQNASDLAQALEGGNRFILDYLVEEVLQRQPDDIQDFLYRTAVLDRLSAPLCDAVTGRSDGQATLDMLEHSDLFIVSLDNERYWYRYHHLFADLLRRRLHQTRPDAVAGLHRRAADWYERHGLPSEAIHHVLAAADFEWAADLIERAAEQTLMRSEVATLLRWVDALPDELVRARPSLCVYHAWALLLAGRPLDAVKARLEDAGTGEAGSLPAEAAVFRALAAARMGDARLSLALSRQALDGLPEGKPFLRSVAAGSLGMAHVLSGDIEAALQAFEESARVGQQIGNVIFAVGALSNLGGLCREQGQLRRAEAIYQRALDFATDEQRQRLPAAARALFGLGDLARERNDLEAAERLLKESIALSYGQLSNVMSCLVLARVKQAQGDVAEANRVMQEAGQLATVSDVGPLGNHVVAVSQVRLWLDQGNLPAALDWVRQRGLDADAPAGASTAGRESYDLAEIEHITLARVYIAQERPDEALTTLEPLIQTAQQHKRRRRMIELLGLKALALQAQGDAEPALAALEEALALAEPEGFVRIFLDEGPAMARLLYRAAGRGIAPGYTGSLLAAFPVDEPVPAARALHGELVEPLSARELEVLQLMAAGASNPEIAHELVISVFTVKKHVTNILGKLAVAKRTQAAARAHELGLIEPGK